MWHHRFALFLFIANILRSTFELGINQMDFCCSNTCCCSLCTAEQCQLPDQPGKQCRCYNTTNVMCLRFKNSLHKSELVELPHKIRIVSVLPEQPLMAQVVPMGITELDIDPLCCTVGNCPAWIKCKHLLNAKRDQSGTPSNNFRIIFRNYFLIFGHDSKFYLKVLPGHHDMGRWRLKNIKLRLIIRPKNLEAVLMLTK
uniref:UPF0506 domain-containing protein n=1 Tax=Elaeophora elaphi TaxID=1147741 RepID=A0A0R3RNR5_9BILA